MRSYCSLFIDAGYLMAAASTRVTGTSLRSATTVDVPALVSALTCQAEQDSGLPLLRVHWYDAGTRSGGPIGNQRDIAALPRVKLRLGREGFNGEQKGVDLKLALDLISHSRNRAAEVVYLVSGDDDLSEAVEHAQEQGVQVISMVVADADGTAIGLARHLSMTVDRSLLIIDETISGNVRRSVSAAMAEVAAASQREDRTASVVPAVDEVALPPVEELPSQETAETAPRVPTPADIAARQAAMASRVVAAVPSRPQPVYTTATGGGSIGRSGQEVDDAIDDVVDKVVVNWWRGATPDGKEQLLKSKPMIPPEIDRALLNDLSNRLAVFDIPQDYRFLLRDRFWDRVARL